MPESAVSSRATVPAPAPQTLLQRLLHPVQPLIQAVNLWLDADGLRMSAAMSFYGMLSLAPLLLLLVGVLGWWVDKSYLEANLLGQVSEVMGERGAEVVRMALASAQAPSEGRLASIVGFVLLLSGATGVFVELQSSFERLWLKGQPPPEKKAWWHMATLRLRGLGYVLAIGFLLLVSLVLSTGLNVVATWASERMPLGGSALLQIANETLSFLITVLLFVGMMRIGQGTKPPLRCLVFGAVVGAALFTAGKQVLALYLSTAAVVSAYGAAGSLVVLLMWIYFSSAILLLSASCARALQDFLEEEAARKRAEQEEGATESRVASAPSA